MIKKLFFWILLTVILSCQANQSTTDTHDNTDDQKKTVITEADIVFTVFDGTGKHTAFSFQGSANQWKTIPMVDNATNGDVTADDHIWSVLIPKMKSGTWGALDEKNNWVIKGKNPSYQILPDGTVQGEIHYDIPSPGPTADVTFRIIDKTGSHTAVRFKGSATNWELVEMYDDATNGDLTADDHTWTVTINDIPSGEWGAINSSNTWLINGSNLVYTINKDGSISGQTEYTIE